MLEEIFNLESKVNQVYRPYIIAEAGVNHEGSMELAKRLIDEAAEGGAHAIKFQTYKANTIASKDSPSYWDLTKESTTSQFALFKKYDKFWKGEYEELKKYCDAVGIEFMSTPFDSESASFLNDLMSVFKISSSDITNLPFIEQIAGYNKPIILSTGASYLWEIQEAVEVIEKHGNKLALLHCILNYPTEDINSNLGMIIDHKVKFPNTTIGYSDHTMPGNMDSLYIATLLGARILEKHFTHDKTLPGNDHYHAMDVNDLKLFNRRIDDLFLRLGDFTKHPLNSENPARSNARRSLVLNKAINKGEIFTNDHLTWKRPASGISPRDIKNVIGKIARTDLEEDTVLKWSMIE